MDLDNIKALVKIFNENDLTKLEINEANNTIKLEKQYDYLNNAPNTISNMSGLNNAPCQTESCLNNTINAPIVGTFYTKPGLDKPDYVKVGQQVKKGETLCIIEAMKVMNEIKADQDLIIKKVLIANGSMVEFEQPIFEIE